MSEMSEKKQIDFRSVTLESIQKVKGTASGQVYAGLVKGSLKGRDMELLRTRLLGTELPGHEKELERQEELIGYMEEDRKKIVSDIDLEKEFIKKLEDERAVAYENYQQALKELKSIESKLEAAAKVMAQFSTEMANIDIAIETAEKRKNDTSKLILVHKSASIGQLMQYSFGKVIITEADASILKGDLVPDVIFDNSLAEGFVEQLPFAFRALPKKELESIKQFVGMAMYYYVSEDEMPVMLYANSDIATLLKKEGM